MAGVDSTLAYIDQSSFLGLRALGRGPLVQYTWIYTHPVDLDGLRRFHRNLGHGLLGRRIERSPLPFGRHHWVDCPVAAPLDVAATEISRDEVPAWSQAQLRLPIDPEHGPAWRMAIQPLAGGGAAVTLVASHTICDGLGMGIAVAEAARGVTRDLGYPAPGQRTRARAVGEDAGAAIRALPEMGRAVVAAVRLARRNSGEFSASSARATRPHRLASAEPATVPAVTAYLAAAPWDARAETLGGTSNSLFAGVAARLGQLTGRVGDDGSVKLMFPVSERTEGDTRGNALTGMTLTIDPSGVTADLAPVRAEIRRNLAALAQTRSELFAPLPLTPLIPRRVARRFEGLALGSGAPIGCSNLGGQDPAVNRPDGSDAEFLAIRQMESHLTDEILHRLGGTLFLASGRANGQVFVSVCAWQPGADNTRERLTGLVREALGEFGLTGTVE